MLVTEKELKLAQEQLAEQLTEQFNAYLPEILKELDRAVREEADENGYGKVKVGISLNFYTNDMKYILAEGKLSFNIKKRHKCPLRLEADATPPLI